MPLYSEGPRDAKIMVVGDFPGTHEVKSGRAFSGYGGDVLDRILSRVGLTRSNIFLTNVCHTAPPTKEWKWFTTKAGQLHLLAGMMQLKKDVEAIRPNVVATLGAPALRVLTGKVSINSWRGSILESTFVKGVKVVGTFHPTSIIKKHEYGAIAEFDLRRVAEESTYPEIIRPPRELILDPDPALLESLVNELLTAEWLAVDIECWQRPDGSWKLACVGFSDSAKRAVTIPCDSPLKLNAIRVLLAAPVKKVMQNGTFDTTVLRDEGFEVNAFEWDTMLAHHALYAECAGGEDEMSVQAHKKRSAAFAKGLAFQTSIYTREPRYKDDGKVWKDTNDLMMFWRYNALDAVVTREIRDVQEKELKEYGNLHVLKHSQGLVEPLISMTRKGIKIDMEKRAAFSEKYLGEIVNLQNFLDMGAGQPVNVSSPDVKWLVYDKLKLPVQYKKRAGGGKTVTADEDALIKLSAKHPNPLLATVLQIRQRRKLVETYLNAAVDSDGRMRCSFDITGTRSGRLSSRASIYGSGCLLPEAEVLTQRGWVRLDQINEQETICQWEHGNKLSWAPAKRYITDFDGEMEVADATNHQQWYTPGHKIPVIHKTSFNLAPHHAADASRMTYWQLPISGHIEGGQALRPEFVRLLAMVQADGSIERQGIRLSFKKSHKINRCIKLLTDAGMQWYEQSAKEGYRRFYISVESAKPIVSFLGPNKCFGNWILQLDSQTLKTLVEETQYWDATVRGQSWMYFTTVPANAEWISTAAHLCGYSCTIRVDYDNNSGYGSGNNKPLYIVAIKPRQFTRVERKHWSKARYKGKVYCVETQTGYFLTRYKGVITVTGNTNLQNIPESLREMFIPDEGLAFIYRDFSQAEARVVAALANDEYLLELFADPTRDIHKETAARIFGISIAEVTDVQRYLGKKVRHAVNYGMDAKRFVEVVNKDAAETGITITESLARQVIEGFWLLHPNHKSVYWANVERELHYSRILTSSFNRKRTFFGRMDDSLHREGYSYIPQSDIGWLCNQALTNIYEKIQIGQPKLETQLLLQVHDSILVQCPTELVPEVNDQLTKCMTIPFVCNGHKILIPTDSKVGFNWGNRSKDGLTNPNGLRDISKWEA